MLLNFYNSFRPDKSIEHPVLGEITCSGYQEAFKKCQDVMAQKSSFSIQCYNLHEIISKLYDNFIKIGMNCYRSETNEEFLNWINKKFEERQKLNEFLRENGSIQPKLQSRNMFYDVFITNADNKQNPTDMQNDEQIQRYFREQMMKNKSFFETDAYEEN